MERARDGARGRGATTRSARQSAKEQGRRRRAEVGREPYGQGREPVSVKSEIAALFDEPGWKENVQVAGVTARWRDVVGDAIADHCSEVSFEAGVVRVRASSTAWATQLGTMSGHIRQLLNEAIGSSVVSEVRVVGPTGRTWVKGPWNVRGRGPRDTYG
jgi:predicted nucleic acid-binding Zn ribbon protein